MLLTHVSHLPHSCKFCGVFGWCAGSDCYISIVDGGDVVVGGGSSSGGSSTIE